MFIGEYRHSIDEKGRLAIPVKFRQLLKDGAVVTKGLDNCLFLYTRQEWRKLADKLTLLPLSKANSRAFARLMLAGAMDIEIDKQGRAMIPEYLRKFSKIGKKVVVAGLYSRLELWDEREWEKYKKGTESKSSDIAEALGELHV